MSIIYNFSGLLFLIVASEGVQIPQSSSDKDETFDVNNNFSINEAKEEFQDTNNPLISDVDVSAPIKTDNYIEVIFLHKIFENLAPIRLLLFLSIINSKNYSGLFLFENMENRFEFICTRAHFQENTKPVVDNFQVSSETDRATKPEELEIFAESLTQQPNLSQG